METENRFDQIKYQNEYNKAHYDRIMLVLPAGYKQKVKERAETSGMKVNAYIKSLILADLEKQQ